MAPLLWTCCGGERFVLLPGVGYTHVPLSLDGLRRSWALPTLLLLWLGLTLVIARLGRPLRGLGGLGGAGRWTVASLASGALLPWLVGGPVGEALAQRLSGRQAESQIGNLHRLLYNYRAEERPQPIMDGKWLSPEHTELVVGRVMENRDRWTINLGLGKGTPTFALGIKYGMVLRSGSFAFQSSQQFLEESSFMWSEFHGVYHAFADALGATLGAPARLNEWLSPPSFIVTLPHVVFTHQLDVHTDRWLIELKTVYSTYPKERPDSVCQWQRQRTVVAALRQPLNGMGLDWWTYGHPGDPDQDVGCEARGEPRPECMRVNSQPYSVGGLAIWDSSIRHAGSSVPIDFSDPVDSRIFMNAFVVPCKERGKPVWEIFGVRGR